MIIPLGSWARSRICGGSDHQPSFPLICGRTSPRSDRTHPQAPVVDRCDQINGRRTAAHRAPERLCHHDRRRGRPGLRAAGRRIRHRTAFAAPQLRHPLVEGDRGAQQALDQPGRVLAQPRPMQPGDHDGGVVRPHRSAVIAQRRIARVGGRTWCAARVRSRVRRSPPGPPPVAPPQRSTSRCRGDARCCWSVNRPDACRRPAPGRDSGLARAAPEGGPEPIARSAAQPRSRSAPGRPKASSSAAPLIAASYA